MEGAHLRDGKVEAATLGNHFPPKTSVIGHLFSPFENVAESPG